MDWLEVGGALAAAVLLVQCILFNMIFVAVGLGLWKGSEWLHKNAHTGMRKVDEGLRLGQKYLYLGLRYLSAPFIRVRGRSAGWQTFRARLRK